MFMLLFSSALAASFDLDPAHTRVGFSVKHLMVTTVRGEFGTVTGTVEYDPKNLGATKVNAVIGAGSIDTREAKRDDHLRSADFLDAGKFPEMKFVSKVVKNVTTDGFDLVGDLTLRGVTKETTLKVAPFSGEITDPWGNVKVGTRATGVINRQDFGVSWNKSLDGGGYVVADEVMIELDVEMNKRK